MRADLLRDLQRATLIRMNTPRGPDGASLGCAARASDGERPQGPGQGLRRHDEACRHQRKAAHHQKDRRCIEISYDEEANNANIAAWPKAAIVCRLLARCGEHANASPAVDLQNQGQQGETKGDEAEREDWAVIQVS